jgi:hypothetical protein
MKKRHTNIIEYIAGINSKSSRAREKDTQRGFNSSKKSIQATSAFADIASDLFQHNPDFAERVYKSLFQRGDLPQGGTVQKSNYFQRWGTGHQQEQIAKNGWPSGYEANAPKHAQMQLLLSIQNDVLEFGTNDIDDIGKELYSFAEVFEGGGIPNLVFTKKELKENNLNRDDIENSMRYFILEPRKRGWTSTFIPDAKQYGTQYGKGVDALKKMSKEMQKSDGWFGDDASMWAAVVPNANGNGVQVVVMAGIKGDRFKSKMVGRMYEQGHDSKGNFITRPISYNNQEMFKKFQSWRRGHFMDAENDPWERTDTNLGFMQVDGLKTRMGKYYDKYSQKDFSPLRARLPYYAPIINGVEIFDAGKFEWENVIKPFWKANKNKSEDEFADEWQKVMDEQTFTMRDKIYDFFNNEFSSSPVDASIVFGDKKQLMDLSYLENNKTDKQKQMLKEEKKYATSSL